MSILEAKLLLGAKWAVAAAVGASQAARLGPDAAAFADPEVAAGAGGEAVKRRVEALTNTALDAEPAKSNLSVVARLRVAVSDQTSLGVDVGVLRLHHVKVLRGADAEADVALKVSGLVVVSLFTGAVLGKVLGGAHDKLSLVGRVRHVLGVNRLVKVSVHGGEVDEGLVVQVAVYTLLQLSGKTFNARLHRGTGRGLRRGELVWLRLSGLGRSRVL